jgi:hypothetical protein
MTIPTSARRVPDQTSPRLNEQIHRERRMRIDCFSRHTDPLVVRRTDPRTVSAQQREVSTGGVIA